MNDKITKIKCNLKVKPTEEVNDKAQADLVSEDPSVDEAMEIIDNVMQDTKEDNLDEEKDNQ